MNCIETTGVLVNNYEEFKEQVIGIYSEAWKKATKKELFKVFGEPKEYPFVLCIRSTRTTPTATRKW